MQTGLGRGPKTSYFDTRYVGLRFVADLYGFRLQVFGTDDRCVELKLRSGYKSNTSFEKAFVSDRDPKQKPKATTQTKPFGFLY